jgi:PhnB protein
VSENQPVRTSIAPWLSVPDGSAAVDFYTRAFGAVERERLADDESGRVIVAQLAIDEADFWVQQDPDNSPPAGGGGPVRMIVTVADPDAAFAKAVSAGGREVSAVSDDHGWRIGRFADPFGHQWEIGRRLSS